jgi:predicted DNA-binding ribbon-helix-helix protein
MSGPQKRSIKVAGHRTSTSMEPEFWQALQEIARSKNTSMAELIEGVDHTRGPTNLSSALRCYILSHYRSLAD